MRARRTRRRGERGFALLLVFAMAAAVAVALYLEMPRVAFEHQRDKELMLVERGEQYTRALELYFRKFSKYPQTIDDLENTNNLRFLRRKYKDPMTGSDEWRLIHVENGQFVDSLVHKRPGQEEQRGPSALAASIQGIGSQAEYLPDQDPTKQAPGLQKRASDRIVPGAPGATPGGAGQEGVPGAGSGENPAGTPPPPDQPPGENPPGQNPQGQNPGQNPDTAPAGTPNVPPAGAPASAPGQQNPQGSPFQAPGAPAGQQGQGQTQPGQQSQPGQQGGGQFGFGGGFGSTQGSTQQGGQTSPATGGMSGGGQAGAGAQNTALQAIRGVLGGQQRPGTLGQGGAGAGTQGAMGGSGIAGVASKVDQEGILVYNEKTNYKEWEFLFDQKKAVEKAGGQPGQGMPGQGGQPGTGGAQNPGMGAPRPPVQPGFGQTPFGGQTRPGGRQ
jgi:hypothetical protein